MVHYRGQRRCVNLAGRHRFVGWEDLVDVVDRERIAYIKHYFHADWPTRSLYHMMLNTAMGNDQVIDAILNTMHLAKGKPKATDYEEPKILA